MARKIKVTTPTNKPGLAIRLENVSWTPFEVLDAAAEIDESITYYALNDHYQYVVINPSDSTFADKRANSLIFTKNAEKDETQISSMEIIDEFIRAKNNAGESNPQFYDTTYNANVPYLSGEIYVANEGGTAISELKIQEYNTLYPSLDIRLANVEKNYTIKYVQVDDITGLTKVYHVQKAKNCVGKAESDGDNYFSNPNRNVTLVPSKNNYDFFGWSKDGTKEGVVISPKVSDSNDYYDSVWEGINFSELAVDGVVTLYAVFELHKYKATFYNYDGSVIGTTETPYSRVNAVNVVKTLPSRPATDLAFDSVYGFAGWALKTAPNRILDMSTVHPIMDYEFIAVYEEKSVYENVLDTSYLNVINLTTTTCRVSVASGVTLSGKITLPSVINGRNVTEIGTAGFEKQTEITHIFWDNASENTISKFGERAFNNCTSLVYYEMSTTTDCVISNQAFRYTNILDNISLAEQQIFFNRVTSIESAAFTGDFTKSYSLTTLYLSGNLKILNSSIMQNYKNLKQIYIGSADNPTSLTSVADGPFASCGRSADRVDITYYYETGNPLSSTIEDRLKKNIENSQVFITGIAV